MIGKDQLGHSISRNYSDCGISILIELVEDIGVGDEALWPMNQRKLYPGLVIAIDWSENRAIIRIFV